MNPDLLAALASARVAEIGAASRRRVAPARRAPRPGLVTDGSSVTRAGGMRHGRIGTWWPLAGVTRKMLAGRRVRAVSRPA